MSEELNQIKTKISIVVCELCIRAATSEEEIHRGLPLINSLHEAINLLNEIEKN